MNESVKEFIYEVRFGCCDGRQGEYKGDTKEDIHQQIDEDESLRNSEKSILKYGYFWEFKDDDYITQDYVIDNGIHFIWKVNSEDTIVNKLIKKVKGLFK